MSVNFLILVPELILPSPGSDPVEFLVIQWNVSDPVEFPVKHEDEEHVPKNFLDPV